MARLRKKYLIDRRFQLRFCFYICSWLLALSMAYPLIISNLFDWLIRYARLDPFAAPPLVLYATKDQIFRLLILLQFFFLVMTFLLNIFISHRIAGPVHKLRVLFKNAARGRLNHQIQFRKGDHFIPLADQSNQALGEIRQILGANSAKAAQAISKLESTLEKMQPASSHQLKKVIATLQEIC